MGGVLSALVTQAACCFGNAALHCFCKICGATVSTSSRVGYALMFLMSACISWLMLTDWAEKKLREITLGYLDLKCPQGECYGVLAVYRICFATTLFHLILAISTWKVSSTKDWRASIQNGYWGAKLIGWAAIAVLTFFIPNEFFTFWATFIDMPGAGLFIFIQVILLIDFAHTLSETLLGWWEEFDDRKYLILLVILTFSSYLTSIIGTGFLYAWFAAPPCQLNQFFISFNWILGLLVSAISVLPGIQEVNPKSGLAPAAMVTLYSTYLVTSALVNEPSEAMDPVCNRLNSGNKTETTIVVLGSLFTFLALAYSTTRAASDPSFHGTGEESLPLNQSSHYQSAVDSGAIRESPGDSSYESNPYPIDDEEDGVQYNYTVFHVIFMLGAMYLAMLITNWNSVVKDAESGDTRIGHSMAAVWVKVVSSWAVLLLYCWTVIAPYVLPDRDWD